MAVGSDVVSTKYRRPRRRARGPVRRLPGAPGDPAAGRAHQAHLRRPGRGLPVLAGRVRPARRRQGDPFAHGAARDYTVRDYRTHLISERRAKPASVNLALAAIDNFCRFVGLGPANTRCEELPQLAPRALSVEYTRRLLRAAERGAQTGTIGGVRDRAVLTVLLFTALRIGALAALDRDDLAISARKGVVTVRRGKGERYRQVPLNAEARDALDAWLDQRTALPGHDGPAQFLSL